METKDSRPEYYRSEEVVEQAKEIMAFAAKGEKGMQYGLAECYVRGYGVEVNYKEAAKWYLKSARQGFSPAQYKIGCCYFEGKGVKRSYKKAVKWYRKAVKQWDYDAQKALARCYREGKGVRRNIVRAYALSHGGARPPICKGVKRQPRKRKNGFRAAKNPLIRRQH